MELAIDIDGTLTNEIEGYSNEAYTNRTPKFDKIELVNRLYDFGHTIILFSSRHEEDRSITTKWLHKYGIKFHRLVLNKLHYDFLIDDRGVHVNNFTQDWVENILRRKNEEGISFPG